MLKLIYQNMKQQKKEEKIKIVQAHSRNTPVGLLPPPPNLCWQNPETAQHLAIGRSINGGDSFGI